MQSEDLPEKLPVGILAATAIGAELTQTTLNTFHYAGIDNSLVSVGISRIQECLNNSTALKWIIFSVKLKVDKLFDIVHTTLNDLCENRPKAVFENEIWWFHKWVDHFGNFEIPQEKHVLFSIQLSLTKQVERGFSLEMLSRVVWKNAKQPWLPQPIACSPLQKGEDGKWFNELILAFVFTDEIVLAATEKCVAVEYPIEQRILFLIETFWIPALCEFHLFGIPEVLKIVEHDNETSLIICNPTGSLLDMLSIDPINIVSNRTADMLKVFGIEVAKKCLFETLCAILDKILPCHIQLIVEWMTWSGSINSISRYSARQDPDVLKRMSFEEAIRNITTACVNGEQDMLKSVSSKIVASKLT